MKNKTIQSANILQFPSMLKRSKQCYISFPSAKSTGFKLLYVFIEVHLWKLTVLGPTPLKLESSALISSIDKSRKYSKHSLPFLSCRQLNTFLIQEAFLGAKPPHLIAFSRLFDSAASTLNKNKS